MSFDRSTMGDVCVLTPKRNLTGGEETQRLTAAVDEITADGVTKVVVDLSRISWVNSMGLAGLQRARLACLGRGATFQLVGVGERIKNLLLTTRLVVLFDTHDTIQEALAAHQTVGR